MKNPYRDIVHDEFILGFMQEGIDSDDSSEQIENVLSAIYHFLTNGLLSRYKTARTHDLQISLSDFCDAIGEIQETLFRQIQKDTFME
ncbi:hypothetical protein JWG44_05430 [Leptospira sp. 201903071]|uniref:hypothetical protein n=1 Tax=Leptospira ainazelensis TaxID=2810034 RepID=UPI001963FC9B|nr:hypothetical protein [Leptospira ainazelensis]MBM9499691.1 hypothetical protein [Leptospira ainazelensis]